MNDHSRSVSPASWRLRLRGTGGLFAIGGGALCTIAAGALLRDEHEIGALLLLSLSAGVAVLVILPVIPRGRVPAYGALALLLVDSWYIALLTVPGWRYQLCCAGNAAAAIGSLRAINSAQAAYTASCARGRYATDLADLGLPPIRSSQGFISPDLAVNGILKSGYIITVMKDAAPDVTLLDSDEACNGPSNPLASSYFASANPVRPGVTGIHYFATDTRGTIFLSLSAPISNPIQPGPNVQVVQ